MTRRHRCPRCEYTQTYVVRRSKRRCARCKYEWDPRALPLRLAASEWKSILMHYFRGLSSNQTEVETGLNKKRILRALHVVREAMAHDIPDVFIGTVEVDETYLGGQWKNKRKAQRTEGTKRGRGTRKTPVFGILCRGGKVWAEVVPDVKAETIVSRQRSRRSG